jgi:hypothetical protein
MSRRELGERNANSVVLVSESAVPGSWIATRMSVSDRNVPRVALSRQEAAVALGMSLDSFERHVQPELRLIRRGKLRLIPVAELERWATDNAESIRGR